MERVRVRPGATLAAAMLWCSSGCSGGGSAGNAGTGGNAGAAAGSGGAASSSGGAGITGAGGVSGSAGSTGSGGTTGSGGADGGACVPNCAGHSCGDDGCNGSCGSCGTGLACNAQGVCAPGACGASCKTGCTQGCFDLGDCATSGGGTLELVPNVFTAGVVLTLASAPITGELYYRTKGSGTWWKGPDLVRIPDARLAGSAFSLAAATSYDVRVHAGTSVTCGTTTTQPETPPTAAAKELWADASVAAIGDGTRANPFRSLQSAVDAAGPGVTIHALPSVYRESVVITKSGAAGQFLRILGEPGAIFDGAELALEQGNFIWKDEGGGVYSAPWSGDPRYVSRDGARLYHYLSLADLRGGLGKNAVPIAEGFFVEGGVIYLRTADAPSAHRFQVPVINTAIQLSGASFVWVEGLEIEYYGEGDFGKGIDVTDGSNDVVVRKNHVHDIPTAVWIRKGSSRARVEDNELNQSTVFSWPWDAVKATDHENDAVTLAGGTGAVVARNVIHDVFNGVYAGSFDDDMNPALAFDTDVYGNRLTRIGDDGFEPEGAEVNARFWGNSVDLVHNGVSVAPITYGPTWVVRNRFTGYDESGFKVSNDTSGRVWLLHNTCFTDLPQHNGMNVSGQFENIVFRNNLIRGTSYSIESGVVVSTDDLDYDALFTTRGAPRVKWNNVRYDDIALLCAATGFECHGVGADPALDAPSSGRFAPTASSPLVDAAVRLYGINDAYAGTAPDIGYVELGSSELPPAP